MGKLEGKIALITSIDNGIGLATAKQFVNEGAYVFIAGHSAPELIAATENLALRQQLLTLKRKHPRPRVAVSDKLFWVLLRRFWPEWKQALIFVQPETVVRWHRAGFKLYWEWLSRHRTRAGRKCVSI